MKEWAKKFYNGVKWRKCRKAFIAKRLTEDGGLCQRCGREPGFIVHHKTYLTPSNINDPEVSLNFSNLEFLCHTCHDNEHLSLLRVRFDENGRIIPPEKEAVESEFSD